MSVVILGGNECMERQYKEICKEYNCKAKVFARPIGSLKNKLGSPDLMIFFTSHKMVKSAMSELKGTDTRIARVSSSSVSSLRSCLETYANA